VTFEQLTPRAVAEFGNPLGRGDAISVKSIVARTLSGTSAAGSPRTNSSISSAMSKERKSPK